MIYENLCPGQNSQNLLTLISLASFFWDLGKHGRPRSDAAERGVWSGSTLFAYRNFYLKYDEKEINTPDTHITGHGLVQLIRIGKSTRQKRDNETSQTVIPVLVFQLPALAKICAQVIASGPYEIVPVCTLLENMP